jgi:SagB-type dehydrogenase family enzyme
VPTHTIGFRRVPHVVCYWRNSDLIACDYLRRVEVTVAPVLLDILHRLSSWQSIGRLESFLPGIPRPLLREAVGRLVNMGLVERSDAPVSTSNGPFKSWQPWTPAAAFFHFSTKNLRYAAEAELAPGTHRKAPSPTKRYPDQPRLHLRPADIHGDLPRILRDRRTWRRFGPEVVSHQDLSTLLGLTWGVQHWMTVPGHRRMALKTSPSGGARHSIEAYVLAQRVEGVLPGLYHYTPDEHALVRVKQGAPAHRVAGYLPAQPGFCRAAAVVFMTSVFERMWARYPYAKAYRAVLAEAGHLAQTFCLVATWLSLAPFCTMAFADAIIEKDLKIDGISESVIYVAGVGARPAGAAWAPWPDPSWRLPRRSRPAHERTERRSRAQPLQHSVARKNT